jgi:adenylate kinase family enzyme
MRMNNNAVKIISVIGGPGSGKGTQCEYLINNFGFKHISLGDLFRREIKRKTPLARQIDQYMQQGQLVPGEIGV